MTAAVYLDHNASTPLAEGVFAAMQPWLGAQYGNASSRHGYGRAARQALDEARAQVAHAVGAQPSEVIFTSGATEANNWIIHAAARRHDQVSRALAISAVEHPALRAPAQDLQQQGWRLYELSVDGSGRLQSEAWNKLASWQPDLLSCLFAHNETGVIQPVAELAQAAVRFSPHTWVHSDAAQALGKIALNFRELKEQGVHALSISAHKAGGPKGIGALIVDKRLDLAPLLHGGGQENGLRSGTENLPAIVGFAAAAVAAQRNFAQAALQMQACRTALEVGLTNQGAQIFAQAAARLPNTTFFALPGFDGETLVGELDRAGFAVASGSACSSQHAHQAGAPVLAAMGVAPDVARAAVRVSLAATTTEAQISDFLNALHRVSCRLRQLRALAA